MNTNNGRFQKGHVPANPIKPGERRGTATEFKPGIVPKNKVPVGTVRMRQHKGDKPRYWVKVAEPNTWDMQAVHVWRSANGAIPQGYVVHHHNENTLDDRIENLELLQRGAHAALHHTGRPRAPWVVSTKSLTCRTCGAIFTGKRENSNCEPCQRQATRNRNRSYKQRLRTPARG